MASDVSNAIGNVPERFEPETMRGELVEAEHLVRYAWAAALAPGRRVLDAGCGLGYGSELLLAGGATEVVGVDNAAAAVEAASARVEGVSFEVGDLRELPFPENRFDLIACFEVIEHVDERARVIAELARVLAPGGLVLVSSPNRDVYVPGNPHHVFEYLPEELREELSGSFGSVQLMRQHTWVTSAVLDDELLAWSDLARPVDVELRKVAAEEPGRETYTLAVAGDGELPSAHALAVLASPVEVRRWLELYEGQQAVLREQHERITEAQARSEELGRVRWKLMEAEKEIGGAFGREQAHLEMEEALGEENRVLRERVQRGDKVVADIFASPSWRLTKPLRALKKLLG